MYVWGLFPNSFSKTLWFLFNHWLLTVLGTSSKPHIILSLCMTCPGPSKLIRIQHQTETAAIGYSWVNNSTTRFVWERKIQRKEPHGNFHKWAQRDQPHNDGILQKGLPVISWVQWNWFAIRGNFTAMFVQIEEALKVHWTEMQLAIKKDLKNKRGGGGGGDL